MNFDVKVNQAHIEFHKAKAKEEKGGLKNGVKSQQNIKVMSSTDFYDKNGEMLESWEQKLDDVLIRAPNGHKRIMKKLNNPKFMKKLQKECEIYVKDNPDQFERHTTAKNKIDYD